MINAIIPARGGSKGIPKKNIVNIGEYPLIAYSITAARLCDSIDRIIVSTDDPIIAEVAVEYGAEVPFVRPKEYATDSSSDFEFLKHFFDNVDCEEVALLRPTTPFRDPLFMDNVIKIYFAKLNELTGLRTAQIMGQPAYKQFKMEGHYFKQLFNDFNGIIDYSNLPRQNFPETYSPNGHIDIIKRNTVKMGSVFGDKIYAVISEKMIDIDDYYDLKIASLVVGSKLDCLTSFIRRFTCLT